MSFSLAFKTFFKILSDSNYAKKIQKLDLPVTEQPTKEKKLISEESKTPIIQKVIRSEAITLLAILQREARLVDFLMEDISAYEDSQIGAAVRDVHKKSNATLQKIFAITAQSPQSEGENITIPENFDQGQFMLSGKIEGKGPYKGVVEHAGWQAKQVELPIWNGSETSAKTIAPIEVEVK